MKFAHILVTFEPDRSAGWIDGILGDQKLRYQALSGVITRYSVEVPVASFQKFLDFFKNLSGVATVIGDTPPVKGRYEKEKKG